MANIDFTGIERQMEDLANTLFKAFVDQAREDGLQFLKDSKQTFLERTGQFERHEISETNYKNGLLNLAALAKMERLKREGLAQVSVDKFTNGVINILIDAGLKAIA